MSSFNQYVLDAVGSSATFKGKQKLGVTFNSDKLGGIDFTKFSKLTMCSAYRVYQSELVETKWLWGIERPIFLLIYGA